MTIYPELTVTIDNRPVQWEEIKHWKAKRALVVLQLFADYGQKVILKNQTLLQDTFHDLSDDDLIQAAKETKLALGPNKILELLQDEFKKSDEMWHQIIARTPQDAPLKKMHIQLDVKGLTIAKIAQINIQNGFKTGLSNKEIAILEKAYDLHPEHYVFSQKRNIQDVVETFGEYGSPTHFNLMMLDAKEEKFLDKIDPRTKKIIFGKGLLASDQFDIQQYALHQFIPTKDGLHVDLGLFAPAGVPDTAIVGHQRHFAIEFSSLFINILKQMHSQPE